MTRLYCCANEHCDQRARWKEVSHVTLPGGLGFWPTEVFCLACGYPAKLVARERAQS